MTTTTLLYNGEVVLDFDEARHRYTANGVPCQGVTGALGVIHKPAIGPWMVKMAAEHVSRTLKPGEALDEVGIKRLIEGMKRAHRETADDAAEVGKIAHKFAEDYSIGSNPTKPVNPLALAAVDGFLKWRDENDVRVLHAERVVYSRALNYAGTCDFIGRINGRLFVADYKTSAALYDEMRFQVAAYKMALVEEGVVPPDAGRMILRFAKDGTGFHVHELPADQDERDREGFLAALKLSGILNQMRAK